MPSKEICLIQAKYAEDSQETQYTAVDKKAIVYTFVAANVSMADVTLSINIVSAGGTAGADNLFLVSRDIGPGETYLCPEMVGQVLEDGDFISTIASAPYSVTIRASGREIT